MKKTLVVLMILAIAGGAFAEGEFKWSGEVRMGADLDFIEGQENIKQSTDQTGFGWREESYGKAALGYTNGGFASSLEFKVAFSNMVGQVSANANYTDDNYKVNMSGVFFDTNDMDNTSSSKFFTLDSLWGYYLFWDKQVKLDVAYKGYEQFNWRANDLWEKTANVDNLDGNSGLVINVTPSSVVDGLSAGFGFVNSGFPNNTQGITDPDDPEYDGDFAFPLYKDWLKSIFFGVKYDVAPITVGLLYANNGDSEAAGLSLGVNYVINEQMTAKAEFDVEGLGSSDFRALYIAGKFEYNAAPLGASLLVKAALGLGDVVKDDPDAALAAGTGILHIEPAVTFDVIPDTLRLALNVPIELSISDSTKDYMTVGVSPAVYWNPKGNEIGDDVAHMLYLKYDMVYDVGIAEEVAVNKLHMGFRWSF